MNRYLMIFVVSAAVLLNGCFKHREAPQRPVTAKSLEQALKLKATVERIEIVGQKIGDLPSDLSLMPNLSILLLRGTDLKSLDILTSLQKLEVLDISAISLTELPLSVTGSGGLKQLYLADNQLTTLAPGIGALKKLEYLNLDRNQLTALPAELGDCTTLRWLRLNSNQISNLPVSISALKSLQRVYLANNKFEEVPESLKDLPLLEDLDLSGNPIKEFPAWLAALPKARQFNFDNCRIEKLPEDLSALKELQGLSLVRCPLPKEEKTRIGQALPNAHIAF